MMTRTRASIIDTDGDDLDLSGFAPKSAPDPSAPPPEKVRAVAEAANFRSREPTPAAPAQGHSPKRAPRRHRTGRNQQFNVKTTPETISAFYDISDRENWVLGETLERALAALQRELGEGKPR